MKKKRILIPLPALGFECSEASVPWQVLTDAGHEVVFATPTGEPAQVDVTTCTGQGLGWVGLFFRAAKPARAAYEAMSRSPAFLAPSKYESVEVSDYDAVVVPGGHHQDMAPFLSSTLLQEKLAEFAREGKVVAGICHGVLLIARAKSSDGRSLLYGRRVTTLPAISENRAHKLCSPRVGHPRFGKPDELTAEEEIRELMEGTGQLEIVKMPLFRDTPEKNERGLCIVDDNFITARMMSDVWTFSRRLVERL